jgi:hypothetical protein
MRRQTAMAAMAQRLAQTDVDEPDDEDDLTDEANGNTN